MATESVKALENLLVLKGGAESVTMKLVQNREGQPLFLVKVTRTIYNSGTHTFFYEEVGSPKWIGGADADRMEAWLTAKFKAYREIQAVNQVEATQAKVQKEST